MKGTSIPRLHYITGECRKARNGVAARTNGEKLAATTTLIQQDGRREPFIPSNERPECAQSISTSPNGAIAPETDSFARGGQGPGEGS